MNKLQLLYKLGRMMEQLRSEGDEEHANAIECFCEGGRDEKTCYQLGMAIMAYSITIDALDDDIESTIMNELKGE